MERYNKNWPEEKKQAFKAERRRREAELRAMTPEQRQANRAESFRRNAIRAAEANRKEIHKLRRPNTVGTYMDRGDYTFISSMATALGIRIADAIHAIVEFWKDNHNKEDNNENNH